MYGRFKLKFSPRVLISDFGECEDFSKLSSTAARTGATGTLEFMAPELLRVDSSGNYTGEHSPKADMWSLGMVLFYLCYSELPYRQVEDLDLLRDDILAFHSPIKFPDDVLPSPRIPSEFKRLISLLLSPEPQRRPSVDEILANARDVDFQKLVPGHYYPTSDSLAVLSLRNSHLRPDMASPASSDTAATTPTAPPSTDTNIKVLPLRSYSNTRTSATRRFCHSSGRALLSPFLTISSSHLASRCLLCCSLAIQDLHISWQVSH